jgi:hypothetical protein
MRFIEGRGGRYDQLLARADNVKKRRPIVPKHFSNGLIDWKTPERTFLAICRLSIITIWNAGVHCALVVADAAMVSSCCTLA